MSAVAEAVQAPRSTNQSPRTRPGAALSAEAESLFEKIKSKPLPIFKSSLEELMTFQNKPSSSIPKMTAILSADPAYAHHIFLQANKGLVNSGRKPAESLQHAILVLGIPQVLEIGKRLPLIESFKAPLTRAHIFQVLSQAYHAGVQARQCMKAINPASNESTFVMAQLQNMHLLSLWINTPKEMALLTDVSKKSLADQSAIIQEVGKYLYKYWNYSKLLQQSLNPQANSSQLIKTISFANHIAQQAVHGWYSPEITSIIENYSQSVVLEESNIGSLIHRNAVDAAKESQHYPIRPVAIRLVEIPLPKGKTEKKVIPTSTVVQKKSKQSTSEKLTAENLKKSPEKRLVPPVKKKTSPLQVLTKMGHEKRSAQEILQYGFRLITKISDNNPVAFFLLDKNKTFLKSRFTAHFDEPSKSIVLPLQKKSIFKPIMQKKQSVLISYENKEKYISLLPSDLPLQIHNRSFALSSLFIQSKPIGLFYLESEEEKELSDEVYKSFISICKATGLALEEVKKHV